jgi:hypothetical protein
VVTLKDIAKAINLNIINGFSITEYNNVEIESSNIKKGFKRPCFYVEFDNLKKGNFNSTVADRNLTVRIHYFPTDRIKNKLELLEVQEVLENIFLKPLIVGVNFVITINELNSKVADGVLNTSFDLHTVEVESWAEGDTDTSELMQELEYN